MKWIYVYITVLCLRLSLCRPQDGEGKVKLKQKYPPPGVKFKSRDLKVNMTIDELISLQLGDIEGTANKVMDAGGSILTELDLLLTPEQYVAFYPPESHKRSIRKKRKAIRKSIYRWTNAEVPYVLAADTFNSEEQFMIREAMTEWERYTCIKFKPANQSNNNLLHFINGQSCSSQLGMIGGRQMLQLQAPGCRFRGLYLHEIGHALGLIHEHQRPDRDNYVDIIKENVSPALVSQFNKRTLEHVDLVDTVYEYSSIMHYGVTAFSYNRKAKTIRTKDPSREAEIGNVYMKELAFNDVKAVNKMYNCAAACQSQVQCRDGGYVDQTCRCVCPDGTRDCEVGYIRPSTDSDCSNSYDDWQCTIWANSGQCERNTDFMSTSCKKACQLCDSDNPSDVDCKDVYKMTKCEVWKERGDCVSNEGWMSWNCRKTCNACIDKDQRAETKCDNKHTDSSKCDEWASEGECVVNRIWMLNNCQKSCQFCHKTPPDIDQTTGDCVDTWYDKAACSRWASSGECQANPNWMPLNCKKSCGECPGGVVPTVVPTPVEPKPGSCVDSDTKCSVWADTGECEHNPVWMGDNCRKSCGTCDGGTVTEKRPCEDTHSSCSVWADLGHCESNPSWMKANCQVSCRVCDGTSPLPPTAGPDGACANLHNLKDCTIWASAGHCDINPDWMHENCRKACGLCRDEKVTDMPGLCGDLYDDKAACVDWAENGECTNNPLWMLVNCKKSCGKCEKIQVTEKIDRECKNSGDRTNISKRLVFAVIVIASRFICSLS